MNVGVGATIVLLRTKTQNRPRKVVFFYSKLIGSKHQKPSQGGAFPFLQHQYKINFSEGINSSKSIRGINERTILIYEHYLHILWEFS